MKSNLTLGGLGGKFSVLFVGVNLAVIGLLVVNLTVDICDRYISKSVNRTLAAP